MEAIENQYLSKSAHLKELELNALLEVTQAINSNVPEDSLYKIFKFILRANLRIARMALFIYDKEEWNCSVSFGLEEAELPQAIPPKLLQKHQITYLAQDQIQLDGFDVALPVLHKNQLLSYLFLGGVSIDGNHETDFEQHLNFIRALSNILVVAVENKRLARERLKQEAYNKEMEIAKNVQNLLFPSVLPSSAQLQIAASYTPHRVVGGDYYDCVKLDENRTLICIADVSGKGVPAAILMSNFQACLRTLCRQQLDLQQMVRELNTQIYHASNQENFITFFVAIHDKLSAEISYINAGHNDPFWIDEYKENIMLDKGTTVLGMFEPLPFLDEGKIKVNEGGLLFAYTDGLTEVFDASGTMFGEERLQYHLRELVNQEPAQINEELLAAIHQFLGDAEFDDDVTLISCKITP
jgi:phosphoserine phosphatase RsbU/P